MGIAAFGKYLHPKKLQGTEKRKITERNINKQINDDNDIHTLKFDCLNNLKECKLNNEYHYFFIAVAVAETNLNKTLHLEPEGPNLRKVLESKRWS